MIMLHLIINFLIPLSCCPIIDIDVNLIHIVQVELQLIFSTGDSSFHFFKRSWAMYLTTPEDRHCGTAAFLMIHQVVQPTHPSRTILSSPQIYTQRIGWFFSCIQLFKIVTHISSRSGVTERMHQVEAQLEFISRQIEELSSQNEQENHYGFIKNPAKRAFLTTEPLYDVRKEVSTQTDVKKLMK
jgi:hypothetical protein